MYSQALVSQTDLRYFLENPPQIELNHWQEWLDSSVAPDLIASNVRSLSGTTAYDYLCYSDKLERRNDGRLTDKWLKLYAHTEAGGWWCEGLDPFNDWQPMDWGCFKPNLPRIAFEKQKAVKYEHPPKTATRAFFLRVPRWVRWQVALAYGVDLPEKLISPKLLVAWAIAWTYLHTALDIEDNDPDFWPWVLSHPEIPILIVEGVKKAGCLLSLGYVTIALPGIFNGRRVIRDQDGQRYAEHLIPELEIFATEGRHFAFCFDHDTKPQTVKNVNVAIARTGFLLNTRDCPVSVITLPGPEKGVDDFIKAQGAASFEQLYHKAPRLHQWKWHIQKQAGLTITPWVRLNVPELKRNIPQPIETPILRESYQEPVLSHEDCETIRQELMTATSLEEARSVLIPMLPQSPLEPLPDSGIVALASAKGTAKTKFITWAVSDSPKVLLLTHRTCLGRSLTERMGLTWRTDADKANGQWIAEGKQATYRLGLCLDSLLSIDPRLFIGCDLVIDELCQGLRHLLTSDTCRKDGKRPALLGRLVQLIQVAKRLLVADADLDNKVLNYLKKLRGDNSPLYLIRNDYKPNGYPVRFIDCTNESAITKLLLKDIQQGKKILIQTDSKEYADAIATLLPQEISRISITSDTSGEAEAIDFVTQINEKVLDYSIVIATPSMSTGVSIEVSHFDKVYGVFFGTIPDADIAQALGRARENIPRVIWCPERGKNFSPVDRSEYSHVIKESLREKWEQEVVLIRASLQPDQLAKVELQFVDPNAHLDLWADITAEINRSMWHLRDYLLARLEEEGNQVEIEFHESDKSFKDQVLEAKQQNWQQECQLRAQARPLTPSEKADLEGRENLSVEDKRALEKSRIADFYAVPAEEVTPDLVAFDNKGRKRSQIAKLEMLMYPELAKKKTTEAIAKQAAWQQGLWVPDLPTVESERTVRFLLGLIPFLVPGQEWTNEDLETLGAIARQCRADIKRWLGFTIPDDPERGNNIWIFRRLLQQLGIATQARRQGRQQKRFVSVDPDSWEQVQAILHRRQQRRELIPESVVIPAI